VPVIFGVNSSSEAEAIAYSVEHNWSVLWGSDADLDSIISMFDQEALTEQLKILDFENSLPLSIDDNLDELLDTLNFRVGSDGGYDRADKEIFEDEVPDPEDVETRVKAGQVWQLDKHRLYCGDSTDLNKIKTFVGDRQIDLLITDPPYGVSYSAKAKDLNDYKEKKGSIRSTNESEIQNDEIKASEIGDQLWTPMLRGMFAIAKPGCAYYVFNAAGSEFLYSMLKSLEEAGWLLKHSLIWVKNNFVFGRTDYHYKHEPCFYGWKPGAGHYFTDSRSESSALEFDKPLKNDLHPTMKPVALIAYLMGNSSRTGELVFDAFLGSGTTLIAAEQSDRLCFGCELSPAYCDVILTRWENLTGKTAVLEGEI
jgi:DNA modification methylase